MERLGLSRRKKPSPQSPDLSWFKAVRADAVLLMWTHRRSPAWQRLAQRIVGEVVSYLPDAAVLTCVLARDVRFFDFAHGKWRPSAPLSQSIKCDEFSSYTPIDRNSLFVCGSTVHSDGSVFYRGAERHSVGREAYILRFSTSVTVQVLPLLQEERYAPGVLAHNKSLYAFGG